MLEGFLFFQTWIQFKNKLALILEPVKLLQCYIPTYFEFFVLIWIFWVFCRGGTSWDFFGSWADELSWPLSNGELSWAFSDFEFGELSWAELFQIFILASRAELSLARAERAKKRAQTEAQIIGMASWTSFILRVIWCKYWLY